MSADFSRPRCYAYSRGSEGVLFLWGHTMNSVYERASAKAAWRLIPFLILCYFVAYLDRVNAGFAALTMNQELGLTAEMFGFGVGIFFLGYFIFEVPSNLLLEKVGARLWIARIMITWGFLAAGTAFVVGPRSFYTMRLLL